MENKVKLHEIGQSLAKLEDLMEKDEDIKPFLDGVKMQMQEKAKNLFYFIKKYDDFEKSINDEIKRLQNLKKSYKGHKDRIKDYISYSMDNAGIQKLESDLVKFSFRKSEAIKIEDESKIDDEYMIIKKVPDKTKIKNDIKAGKEVAGANLIQKSNLQIK